MRHWFIDSFKINTDAACVSSWGISAHQPLKLLKAMATKGLLHGNVEWETGNRAKLVGMLQATKRNSMRYLMQDHVGYWFVLSYVKCHTSKAAVHCISPSKRAPSLLRLEVYSEVQWVIERERATSNLSPDWIGQQNWMFAHFSTWIEGLICSTLQIPGKRNWSQGIVYTAPFSLHRLHLQHLCHLLLWAEISQRFLSLPLQVSALCRLCLQNQVLEPYSLWA